MQIDLRYFENLPQHVYVFAIILAVLTAAFVLFFILPSFVVSWRLSRITKRVRGMEGKAPAEIGPVFGGKGVLSHLWREYSHTLHAQAGRVPPSTPGSDPNKTGSDPNAGAAPVAEPEIRWRSTVPAEALFRPEIVVDTPLRTEFFRHLPGLFTGVGIIGTFYGLLMGLRAFQVSENAVIVRDSLNNLLHGVYEAFLVSAVAIALAMIVTLIERLVIARLYAKVEKLVQALDALFEAGAGEEYLARLVKASESSADRNAALKDALASELKQALSEIAERQIAATHALSERLGGTIESGLKQPLLEVAEGLRGLRTEQWGAVQGMLDHVMSGHTQKLQGLFGEQVTGIHALEQKTIDTLNTAVSRLEQMANSVESAGTRGASAMSERLEQALAAAESRQRTMNETMAQFVEQIRALVAQSQGETQGRLQNTLDELATRMAQLIDGLSRQVQTTTEATARHHEALSEQTTRMVGAVGGQITGIVEVVNRSVGEMKTSVDEIQRTTIETSRQHHQALAGETSRMVGEVGGQLSAIAEGVNRQVNEMRGAFEAMQRTSAEATRQQQEALAEQTSRMVGEVGGQLSAIVDGVNRQVGEMRGAVEAMQRTSAEATRQHHEALAGETSRMVGEVGGQISAIAEGVNRQVSEMRGAVETMQRTAADAARQHQDALAEQTSRVVGEIGGQISAIVEGVNHAASEMRNAVDAMQRSTNDALVSLNLGANSVSTAAADFARAGEAVSGAIEKSDIVAERLAQAAQSVAGVSRGLTAIVSDYAGARDAIAELVPSLQSVVEQAKRETAVSEEIVRRIESATTALADAQREAGAYLSRVNEVLGEAHGAFSQGVRRTLEEVNSDFHRQLSESVRLLRIGIQELQAAVESVNR